MLYPKHSMVNQMWELYMNGRIGGGSSVDVDDAAISAEKRATEFQTRVRFLEDHIDRLTLLNAAMWSLLSERSGLTDEQLLDRVTEIDLRDGRADGKISHAVTLCSKCGRTLHARHSRCIYCGEPVAGRTAFDAV